MTEQQAMAYHARRLVVVPRRRSRSRGATRVGRVLSDLVTYGFVIVYTVLIARLLLLLIPGSISGILTRMLTPVSDPLVRPFTLVVPDGLMQGSLALIPAILAALVTAFVAHRLIQAVVTRLSRPRLDHATDARRIRLPQTVVDRPSGIRVVSPAQR